MEYISQKVAAYGQFVLVFMGRAGGGGGSGAPGPPSPLAELLCPPLRTVSEGLAEAVGRGHLDLRNADGGASAACAHP